MFSFIKWFEAKWQEIKKNKGLWFSILTVFSLFGIFISLYFVNYLVSDVAKKTYENQKKHYILESKVVLDCYNKNVLAIATAIARDTNVHLLFQSEDENKTQKLTAIAANYTQVFSQNLNSNDIFVHFTYSDKLIDTKMRNGLIVNPEGLIAALKEHYNKEKKEFALLLNRGAYSQIDPKIRTKQYQNILESYYVDMQTFDSEFIQDIKLANIKQLHKEGYIKDLNYFFVAKKAYSYDGQEIGLMIIGEKINEKNSFVNLIKNLVNSVTIVALGLIVSMILFLF